MNTKNCLRYRVEYATEYRYAAFVQTARHLLHRSPRRCPWCAHRYLVLGWGRDFGDVSPIQGVIQGGGEHELAVGVTSGAPSFQI